MTALLIAAGVWIAAIVVTIITVHGLTKDHND